MAREQPSFTEKAGVSESGASTIPWPGPSDEQERVWRQRVTADASIPDETPLKFSFSAHLLEDLGVNLYTSLAKALVEFVANAYDADSPRIRIEFDTKTVESEAHNCRRNYEQDLARAGKPKGPKQDVAPLEKRTLHPSVTIVLEDQGHGMTKAELEEKFLVIGRRRREGISGNARSKSGKRLVMGRKGLGKLAGFGIAHRIEVASRAAGTAYTTEVALDYDELISASDGSLSEFNAAVPTNIRTKGGLKRPGTRITLSRLVYQTLHSVDEDEIVAALARHFSLIDPKEFSIKVNDSTVKPPEKQYAYAWPEDAGRDHAHLVPDRYVDKETGCAYTFAYRLRFTEQKKYLRAMERGVRVYAHNRLASFPSMLNVNTSAHGFRYSDYLDGIVVADFIDELPTDYIATDRSDLRWETPPLAGMREMLTAEIQKALGKFADRKIEENTKAVSKDPYTARVIEESDLPEHRKRTAVKFAVALAANEPQGIESDYYKTTIKEVVGSLGHGDIIAAINRLAGQARPDLSQLVTEITRSTQREFDEFVKFCQVRLRGIEGLEKIVKDQDFREGKCEEKALHRLLAKNPWLINPAFSQLLTSDERETVLAGQLGKHLQIGSYTPKGYDLGEGEEKGALKTNRRPDLVFLLSSKPNDHARGRVIVVELKAPNTPLHSGHLEQLEDYIREVEKWRDTPGRTTQFDVYGELIGSLAGPQHKNQQKVQRLASRMQKDGPHSQWRVRDIADVLAETKTVHKELIATAENVKGPGT